MNGQPQKYGCSCESPGAPTHRSTHSADGYALGSVEYPNNRAGRRALARTWKRANR